MNSNKPETLFETASYELNQFRERRLKDRRFQPRGTADRRAGWPDGGESEGTGAAPTQPGTGGDRDNGG